MHIDTFNILTIYDTIRSLDDKFVNVYKLSLCYYYTQQWVTLIIYILILVPSI